MAKAEVIKQPVQKISDSLKQSAWLSVLESLLTVILGIFLIAWPDVAIKIISYVVGVFFIVKGTYQIINYFVVKGQNDFFDNSLLFGIISVLVGISVLLMGEEITSVFRIVIGIWMIYEALVRVNTSIKLNAAKISAWKYTLVLAICMLIIGIFVTFSNGAIITLVGWMMVLAGIIGVVSDVMFIQYVNDLIKQITSGKNE